MSDDRFLAPNRSVTLIVHEPSPALGPQVRHFEARLFESGEVYLTGIDDPDWFMFAPDSAAGVVLAAILAPAESRVDRTRLTSRYFSPLPDVSDPLDDPTNDGSPSRPAADPSPVPVTTTTVTTTITTGVQHRRTPAVHPGWLTPA